MPAEPRLAAPRHKIVPRLSLPAHPRDTRCTHFLIFDFFCACLSGFLLAIPWGGFHHIPGKVFSCCRSPLLCSAQNLSETFRALGHPGEFCSTEGALPAGFPWEGFVRDEPPSHVLHPGSGGELGWGCHSPTVSGQPHSRPSPPNFIPPWGHTSAHSIRHLCGFCRLQRNISLTPVEVGVGSTRAKDTLIET